MPLTDIPITLYTVAELMRLCLRQHDAETHGDAASNADSVDSTAVEDEVVGTEAFQGSYL